MNKDGKTASLALSAQNSSYAFKRANKNKESILFEIHKGSSCF